MYVTLGDEQCFLIAFIDECSRYLVHWELLSRMDGIVLSTAAQAALKTLPRDAAGKLAVRRTSEATTAAGTFPRSLAVCWSTMG